MACTADDENTAPEPEVEPVVPEIQIELTTAELQAAQSMTAFNYDFFKAVSDMNPSENTVVSPLSAQMLLAMVANISDGTGKNEIVNALGCSDIDALNSLCNKYMTAFPAADRNVKMALANSVWHHNAYDINPQFAQVLNNSFDAEVFKRDFISDSRAVIDGINQWCAENTDNLIDHIIDSYSPDMVALLANAMLFKGQWDEPFDTKNTRGETFRGAGGNTSVSMMHQTLRARHIGVDGYSAVSMVFGKGVYSVWLVLPDEGVEINSFLNGFSLAALANERPEYKEVKLAFPKFRFATDEIDLKGALGTLGVNSIFENNSLSIFTTPFDGLFSVSQKASIEFNEKGAEAAAVSWAGIEASMPSPGESVTMTFDRPFLFFINEAQSGACLMAGKIMSL